MNIYVASGLINALVSTLLGFFVFYKNKKVRTNQTFFFFCISVAVWSYAYVFWQLSDNYNEALFFSRLLMAGAIFIPFTYFHYTIVFIREWQEKKIIVYIGYVVAFIFSIINFTNFFISGLSKKLSFNYWPEPGIFFHPFLIIWLFYVCFATFLLIKKYYKSNGVVKIQIKYMVFGMIIGYIGGMTNYLLWYDILIFPIGNICVSFYVAAVAYAITRYRFMDIKIILKKSFVYILALSLLLGAVIGLTVLIQFILRLYFNLDIYISTVVIVTLVVVFLPRARDYFRDKFNLFFKKDYIDLAKKFEEVEKNVNLVSELKLDNFCKELSEEIVRIFKLSEVNFFVFNQENNIWVDYNFKDKKEFIKNNNLLVKLLDKSEGVLVRDELKYIIEEISKDQKFLKFSKKSLSILIKKMTKRNFSFIVPLVDDSKLIGFIGGKGDIKLSFSKNDIETLNYVQKRTVFVLKGLIL